VNSGRGMSLGPGGVAFRAAALALVLLTLAGLPAAEGDPSASAPFAVSLTATPSYGTPPLTVAFQASATSGTPTLYEWSFGDGATYNGSNASAAAPSHEYAYPGDYNATVTIVESSGSNSSSVEIHVVTRALTAAAAESVEDGPAPLTETFTATVSGGSGTYVNYSWTFGDGSTGEGNPVRYTYHEPGSFHVRLEVFDSADASANASVWVNVTADTPSPAPSSPSPLSGLFSALPWALGGALAGGLAVWSVSRFRLRSGTRTTPAPPIPSPGATAPGGSPGSPSAPPTPDEGPVDTAIATTRPMTTAPGLLRVSQRVILHLARQGQLGESEVAPATFTQGGMSDALGIPQTSLTNVLRRLIAAGVLTQDVRHVRGRDRRLKVYRLTTKGEALARDLAHPRR
jgi:PKD repeat protein/DNA-binding MarR family transcriptional regulator